ncbi:hypothetical protein [Aurantimonas endophytica]|uniref:Uncharacterized protein n=1 Tax=Aurantimonas endophytica TaxID=1522175 RepID=A0A7W6HC16_9HYPH|nr:hypothetical protein [Aurantimonas endophytica]MBB4002455.1 hypothetical protein [Aurantimonas endophytica]MCO6401924.1 hypothetical protein [Aurantimonas endophytica]
MRLHGKRGPMEVPSDLSQAKFRRRSRRALGAVLVCSAFLSGCSGAGLPPVFGAVFGLEGAEVAPFTVGTVPEPTPSAGDRVLGLAASSPGQCIYLRSDNRRFRATCPEGYKP